MNLARGKIALVTVLATVMAALGFAAPAHAYTQTPLESWWKGSWGDNYTPGSSVGRQAAANAGYRKVRTEGKCVAAANEAPPLNGLELLLYWHSGRQDNFVAASRASIDAAIGAGYQQIRRECWIYATPMPGTVPLYTFYHQGLHDNFATATQAGRNDANAAGYYQVRIEGYVYP